MAADVEHASANTSLDATRDAPAAEGEERVTSDRKQRNHQRATPPLHSDQRPPLAATLVDASAAPTSDQPDEPQDVPQTDPDLNRYIRDDRDADTLRALAALTETALAHRSLDSLLPELAACVRAQLRADAAEILLADDDTGELVVRAAHGLDASAIGERIPPTDGLAGQVAAQRAPLAAADLWAHPTSRPSRLAGLRSALGAPLLDGDRVLGVVQVGSVRPRQFSATEIRLLEQLASRMARSVAYAQALHAAEEARHSAERRAAFLNTTLEALGDGLIVTDAEGRVLYGNPAFSALLGVAPTDAIDFVGDSTTSDEVAARLRLLDVRDTRGNPLGADDFAIARALRGDMLSGPDTLEIQIRRLDGQQAFLSITGAPVRDASGELIGAIIAARDVTERQRLEDTLRQRTLDLETANTRLSTLVEVLPVGVAIVDAEGKPLLINEAIRSIWGQRLLMAENASQYGEYRGWRTDTGEPVTAEQWGLARALNRGDVTVGEEYDIETFDGQRKTIFDSAAPLRDDTGAITGAVSVILDISEQKRRTERTRAALDAYIAITQALAEAPDHAPQDGDGAETADARAARENPLARRLAELTRGILGCARVAVTSVEERDGRLYDWPVAIIGMEPELEKQWWDEQVAARPREAGLGLLPADRERLLSGEPLLLDLTRPPYQAPNTYGVTTLLWTAMRTQGQLVGFLALDFVDPDGRPHTFTREETQIAQAVARLGAVALQHDRLLREREIARAEALALAEANRRMDEFLSIAGHELRTPVTTVKVNLQLAERRTRQAIQAMTQTMSQAAASEPGAQAGARGKPLTQLLRLLAGATQAAHRQERMVEDLLDVSRISSGRLEYRMEPLDLTELAREMTQEQRLRDPERLIEMDAPDEPIMVLADADRIGQVLTNYLTNAAKYSEADRPIVVTLRARGARARVEVRDQGPGLTPEQRRHLFARFHRAEGIEVLSGSGVGLGLGLYISKTIVEQHGGSVGVESAPGKGSVFWFELSLAEDERAEPAD